MKRVLIVTSSYPASPARTFNAGGFVRDVARALQNFGHPVCIVTPAKDRPVIEPELRVLTFPWLRPSSELATLAPNPWNFARLSTLLASGVITVAALVKAWRAEHILTFWAVPSGLMAYCGSWLFPVPYSVWALGSDIWARRRYPLGEAIVRRVLSEASFRLADGISLAQEVQALCRRPCEFVPSARNLPANVGPAKLPGSRRNFLFVGRFEYQKGIDILIDGISLLRNKYRSLNFHIVGDGSLRDFIYERVRANRLECSVHFYGYGTVDTVVAMMKACDYLIIPSRIESIPVVLSDAVKCGLPVIVTDVGDMGFIVSKYGIGFVVERPSPDAIAAGIEAAVGTPKRLFADNLRAASRLFDIDRIAWRVSNLIEGRGDGSGSVPVGLLADLREGAGAGEEAR